MKPCQSCGDPTTQILEIRGDPRREPCCPVCMLMLRRAEGAPTDFARNEYFVGTTNDVLYKMERLLEKP